MKAQVRALLRRQAQGRHDPDPAGDDGGGERPGQARRGDQAVRRGRGVVDIAVPRDGVVRVSRQTKGRKGKGVTLVIGAPVAGAELAALARELKTLCGAGGTLRGDVVEVQGDHRDRIVAHLQARGWTVKRAGG